MKNELRVQYEESVHGFCLLVNVLRTRNVPKELQKEILGWCSTKRQLSIGVCLGDSRIWSFDDTTGATRLMPIPSSRHHIVKTMVSSGRRKQGGEAVELVALARQSGRSGCTFSNNDSTIEVLKLSTHESSLVWSLDLEDEKVITLAFSGLASRSLLLAIAGSSGAIRLVHAQTGTHVHTIDCDTSECPSAHILRIGFYVIGQSERLFYGDTAFHAAAIDVASGNTRSELYYWDERDTVVHDCTLAPNGALVAFLTSYSSLWTLLLTDCATFGQCSWLEFQGDAISSSPRGPRDDLLRSTALFSPDSTRLAISLESGRIALLDVPSRSFVSYLHHTWRFEYVSSGNDHNGQSSEESRRACLAFSPDSNYLLANNGPIVARFNLTSSATTNWQQPIPLHWALEEEYLKLPSAVNSSKEIQNSHTSIDANSRVIALCCLESFSN